MPYTHKKVNLNGCQQDILILAQNTDNPVLLIVHGGPGSPDRPLVLKYNDKLQEYYTVVCWDQRGAGFSYCRDRLTIDLMLADMKALVEYLIKEFHQDQIYIAGHSWGAYLGLRFSALYPQYVKYYVGTGQGVSSQVDEIEKYTFVKEQAEKRNDEKVLEKLILFGVPSGYNYPNEAEKAIAFVGKMVQKYGGYIHPNNNFSMKSYLGLYFNHYKKDIWKVLKGINYSVKCLNPEINSTDEISCITELRVPVLLISGEQDYVCPVPTT